MVPYWVARNRNPDNINKAYLSLIFLHNFYNNPIFLVASKLMIDSIKLSLSDSKTYIFLVIEKQPKEKIFPSGESKKKLNNSNMKRFVNKLWVALLLYKLPQLKEHRKKHETDINDEEEKKAPFYDNFMDLEKASAKKKSRESELQVPDEEVEGFKTEHLHVINTNEK